MYIDISSSGAKIKWIRSGTINRHIQNLPSVLFPTTARNKRETHHVRLGLARLEFRPDENFHRERVAIYFILARTNRILARVRERSTHVKSFRSYRQTPCAASKKQKSERRKCNGADSEKFISSGGIRILFISFFFSFSLKS